MQRVSRRSLLKGGALAGIGALSVPGMASPGRTAPKAATRERLLFDPGWRFHLGHAADPSRDFGFGGGQNTYAKAGANTGAAAAAGFDDHGWALVDLPHDWAVALPFVASTNPPPDDDPRAAHGFRPLGRDYPETSIGWYRRAFDVPAFDSGRRLSLEFDGVFRDCLVMVNGYVAGRNDSGYAPFRVDITDFVNCGERNQLAVRVDATLGEGWFYEGAGIYRHVWLVKTDPLHIAQWGVWVRSALDGPDAALTVETEIENESDAARRFRLEFTLLDPDGKAGATTTSRPIDFKPREARAVTQRLRLAAPRPWSVETPNLYRVAARIVADGMAVDEMTADFGIRSARFDAERGFLLNGKPLKLQGTCNHQDHAGVGAALPDRLHASRVETLKAMGSNAYRAAHNPPAPELLDACDRLGMLVIDETRRMSADGESMSELARLIRRDRNHPSVILWSIGNEEPQQGTARGARVAGDMTRLVRRLDPTRPITAAVDDPKAWGLGITPVLDVLGCNYRTDQIPAFHTRQPDKPVFGSETGSTVSTRGIYLRDPASGYSAAYDTEFPWWASTAEAWWKIVAPAPYIAGGFVWTGFDYRGEPTPFNRWPNVASQFGIFDSCGFPKDNCFYYKAQWRDAPLLHLFPHWTWPGREGQAINVWCHSNLDRVELLVNGTSAGVQDVPRYGHVEWNVPFAPGAIEARGYKGGRLVLTERRETSGPPAQIRLVPDRAALAADGEDVASVRVEIADAAGRLVPTAAHPIAFHISGPGAIIGVGNGDPRSHEPDKATQRNAFNGLCLALVQAARESGTIHLDAEAPGLAPATLALPARAARIRPFVAA
ncbi:MAG: beta-galactosidase GalA [Rhizomicrobium sp.]